MALKTMHSFNISKYLDNPRNKMTSIVMRSVYFCKRSGKKHLTSLGIKLCSLKITVEIESYFKIHSSFFIL